MDLYEYQGKQHLARFGIPIPRGSVVDTVEQAVAAADALDYPVVVKAQVLAGGRGKAGGVRLAADAAEVRARADGILGRRIGGQQVLRLLIEEASELAHEYYASFTFDRATRMHLGMVSAKGGVDIEEVAREHPTAIARVAVNPLDGLTSPELRKLVADAGLGPERPDGAGGAGPERPDGAGGAGPERPDGAGGAGPERPPFDQLVAIVERLYAVYTEGDADLVEVNPLAVTSAGRVLALDAKVTLDDNAAFRHPEWGEWQKSEVPDERERLAAEKGLNYVGLAGTVGIIGNGAGLVMSTLDVVNQVGGTAANFLDVGGGAGADVVAAALDVVNSDDNVRAILVNIFGGITRGEQVARGIIDALDRVDLRSPIVVRLDGTNAEEGRALLAAHTAAEARRSGGLQEPPLISEPTMISAAHRAVELAARLS